MKQDKFSCFYKVFAPGTQGFNEVVYGYYLDRAEAESEKENHQWCAIETIVFSDYERWVIAERSSGASGT